MFYFVHVSVVVYSSIVIRSTERLGTAQRQRTSTEMLGIRWRLVTVSMCLFCLHTTRLRCERIVWIFHRYSSANIAERLGMWWEVARLLQSHLRLYNFVHHSIYALCPSAVVSAQTIPQIFKHDMENYAIVSIICMRYVQTNTPFPTQFNKNDIGN